MAAIRWRGILMMATIAWGSGCQRPPLPPPPEEVEAPDETEAPETETAHPESPPRPEVAVPLFHVAMVLPVREPNPTAFLRPGQHVAILATFGDRYARILVEDALVVGVGKTHLGPQEMIRLEAERRARARGEALPSPEAQAAAAAARLRAKQRQEGAESVPKEKEGEAEGEAESEAEAEAREPEGGGTAEEETESKASEGGTAEEEAESEADASGKKTAQEASAPPAPESPGEPVADLTVAVRPEQAEVLALARQTATLQFLIRSW